jgi:hypothetical protein
MSDSELVALWPSDLTDVARGCADEELSRRQCAVDGGALSNRSGLYGDPEGKHRFDLKL